MNESLESMMQTALNKRIQKEPCQMTVQIMQACEDDPDVCSGACLEIARLIKEGGSPKRKLIIRSGGYRTILNVLQIHLENAACCAAACKAISEIVRENTDVDTNKGYEDIIRVLKRHSTNADCCTSACEAISLIGKGDQKDHEAVAKVIQNHVVNDACCASACRALSIFQWELQVGQALADVVGIHRKNVKCCVEVYRTLSIIIEAHPISFDEGACELHFWPLKCNLRSHDNKNASLCREACRAIKAYSHNADNRKHLRMTCKDVVQVMKEFPEDVDVCGNACEAIYMLALDKDNMALIRSAGGWKTVLKALNTFPEILGKASSNIEILLDPTDEHQRAMWCETVVTAFDKMEERNKTAYDNTLKVVMKAYKDEPHLIRRVGKCATIVGYLTAESEPEVIIRAFDVLRILAHNEENRQLIGTAHGCETIINILQDNGDDEDDEDDDYEENRKLICSSACGAILMLAQNEDNKERIRNSGGQELLKDIMLEYTEDEGVRKAYHLVSNENNSGPPPKRLKK